MSRASATRGVPPAARPENEADVRVGSLQSVPALLREAGIDPQPLLAGCGLAISDFDDADTRVPFRAAACMLLAAAQATGRQDFGLCVGQRFDLASLGLLSALLQRAPTVGQALELFTQHLSLNDRGGVAYLKTGQSGRAAIGYAVQHASTPGVGLIYDLTMAIGMNILRAVCGPLWQAQEVRIPHARPARPQDWRRHFGAPVVFDATAAEIWFDAAWLRRALPLAEPAAQVALLREAQRGQAELGLRLSERTRRVVVALLMSGALSAERVASVLSMHPRTLRRRLAEEGVSLQGICQEARFDLARQLLRGTQVPLADVADVLGYGDLTAFVRAFRTWAGCTPGRWREAAPRDGPAALLPPSAG